MKYIGMFAAAIILFASCKKTKTYPALSLPVDTQGNTVQLDSFPLRVGNVWSYMATYQDGTNAPQSYNYTNSIVSDTTVNSFHLYKVVYQDPSSSDAYYLVRGPLGLYQVTGSTLSTADSAHIYDSLNLSIKYPTHLGDSWSYNTNGSVQYARTWLAYTHINTSAGSFNCLKMVYTDPSGSDTFYYADKGFIMEKTGNATISGHGAASVIKLVSVNF